MPRGRNKQNKEGRKEENIKDCKSDADNSKIRTYKLKKGIMIIRVGYLEVI